GWLATEDRMRNLRPKPAQTARNHKNGADSLPKASGEGASKNCSEDFSKARGPAKLLSNAASTRHRKQGVLFLHILGEEVPTLGVQKHAAIRICPRLDPRSGFGCPGRRTQGRRLRQGIQGEALRGQDGPA